MSVKGMLKEYIKAFYLENIELSSLSIGDIQTTKISDEEYWSQMGMMKNKVSNVEL